MRQTEENVTLDQNNKAERHFEMQLAFSMFARIVDENKTGIPNLQITVTRDNGVYKRSLGTNSTDNQGVFRFVSSDMIFMTKDILTFNIVDPANIYKSETVTHTVLQGQTQVEINATLTKFSRALLVVYLGDDTNKTGTQATFDFSINGNAQPRLETDNSGLYVIHQSNYPDMKIGSTLSFKLTDDKYLNDINQQVTIS